MWHPLFGGGASVLWGAVGLDCYAGLWCVNDRQFKIHTHMRTGHLFALDLPATS